MIERRTLLQGVGGLAVAKLAEARGVEGSAAASEKLASLTKDQARLVAAIAERIWPGAVAAGTVTYIDRALAQAYRAEARLYHLALPLLDASASRQLGTHFATANPEQQDALLRALEAGELKELSGAKGRALFELLRRHVMEGVLADPIYGGNRDFAGWKAVGYPGPYRVHAEGDQTSMAPVDMPFHSVKDL